MATSREHREHRRCLLRISQELSSEDLHSLIYLTYARDNGIRYGFQLFDLLSRRRQLGQGYSFLIDCLRDIGRNDLAKKITEEIPDAVVEAPSHVRQSLDIPEQIMAMKCNVTLVKRKQYFSCMKDLGVIMRCGVAREGRFDDYFYRAFGVLQMKVEQLGVSKLSEQQEVSSLQDIATASVTHLSLFWKMWPQTLAIFQRSGQSCNIKPLMEQCHTYYDLFDAQLPSQWSSDLRSQVRSQRAQRHHPVGSIARQAHKFLHELSSEMIGEQALQDAEGIFENALFTTESVNYTARYLLPIYKWLLSLAHLATTFQMDILKGCEILQVVFSDHRVNITRNWEVLSKIVGEEAMNRINTEFKIRCDVTELSHDDIDGDTYSKLTQSVALVWHVSLAVIACAALHVVCDCNQIQYRLTKYMATQKELMKQTYLLLSQTMAEEMQRELDHYKGIYEQLVGTLGSQEAQSTLQSLLSSK